jgi:hypothetical protein
VLACIAKTVPLQHYITLSRYQHWAIALFIWSLGFFFQCIRSWNRISVLGRIALLCGGLYVSSAATALYMNPWMDTTVSLETTEQAESRFIFSVLWAAGGLLVGILWMVWGLCDLARVEKLEKRSALFDLKFNQTQGTEGFD